MKIYELDGYVTVPDNTDFDEFIDAFINFIESRGWTYGGGMREANEEDAL